MNNQTQLTGKLLESIFDLTPIIFWTVDKNLIFTSFLGGGLKLLGLEKNQFFGKSLYEYFKTNDHDFEPIAQHIKVLKGEKTQYEFQCNNRYFRTYLYPMIFQDVITGVIGISLDMSEEFKLINRLKDSEEKYKSLFESASDAIFLMDNDIFIDCNEATLKMFNCKREEIIGQPPYKFSPTFQPDGRLSKDKAIELIQRAFDGEHLAFHWIHSKLDGTLFDAEVRLNRISYNNKYFLLAIVRDVTENKEKENQIRLLANALECVNECISITDLNDKIIYVNKKFIETYGYEKEELIGNLPFMLRSNQNDPELGNKIYLETLKGGWKGELWNKRKNGEEFLISLSTSPVIDQYGKTIAYIGIALDITKEKELFNKIKYDAERLNILFENAPDAIFVLDFDGKIVEANLASEIMVGWKRSEVFGKTFYDLNILDRKNFFRVIRILYNALNSKPTRGVEFEIFNKNREKIYVEVATHPIEIENKKLILCTARDITERKKILHELAQAKEEAEIANRQKTVFFASMSHEIRTPINSILGFTEVLKDLFYQKSEPEVKNYFDILQNSANSLLRTVSQLLELSRIETGSFKYQIKQVDFKNEIQSAVDMLKVLADKKNLSITIQLPEEDVIVEADQYSLNGILTNLISNAIKYSEKGIITIELTREKNFAVCSIKDEGIGMSEEFQKKMFTDFAREDSEKVQKKEGSGLGLALTKRYIEINRGEISVKSKKGVGTTVTFKIPLATLKK